MVALKIRRYKITLERKVEITLLDLLQNRKTHHYVCSTNRIKRHD